MVHLLHYTFFNSNSKQIFTITKHNVLGKRCKTELENEKLNAVQYQDLGQQSQFWIWLALSKHELRDLGETLKIDFCIPSTTFNSDWFAYNQRKRFTLPHQGGELFRFFFLRKNQKNVCCSTGQKWPLLYIFWVCRVCVSFFDDISLASISLHILFIPLPWFYLHII